MLSHKTLGVATPVLWDDGDKASRTSYDRRRDWSGGLPQVLDASVISGTQDSSKAGPDWPRGEEAERLLAEYREHSEHNSSHFTFFLLRWDEFLRAPSQAP